MTNFEDMGLPENILHTLQHIEFTTPTPIQEQAIPVALEGHDILGSAQTGTGKTAAFAIPMINHLIKTDNTTALVLLPTRELAQQVLEASSKILGKSSKIKSALLIGGDSMVKQLQQLKNNPRIIVGTPGRINDHLKRRSLKLDSTNFLVLDETDRMLDMGFGIQLDEIAKYLPKQRQTLMFSATLPNNIMSLSRKYLNAPVRIACGSTTAVATNVKQELVKTNDAKKYGELMNQLNTHDGSVLVFVKTKFGAERLAKKLTQENQSADAIHGDLKQCRREKVIANFRQQKYRILVATDIAARGLDIPHIQSVINYDLPQCPEDYIHRIGRTARAGASGVAINLLTASDASKWKAIYKLMNPSKKECLMLTEDDDTIDAEPLTRNENSSRRPARRIGEAASRRNSKSDNWKGASKALGKSRPKSNGKFSSQAKADRLGSKAPTTGDVKIAFAGADNIYSEKASAPKKARTSRFNDSAADFKAPKSRSKFNKNSKSFSDFSSKPSRGKSNASRSRRNFK